MISPFYTKYTLCKNNKLSGYHNTADLINFLKQIPQLTQTIQHHFSNSADFPHFISLTLLSTNYQPNDDHENTSPENHSYEYTEEEIKAAADLSYENHQTNLIVVLASRSKNAGRYVEPILEKIAQYLNWELMYDEDKEETDNLLRVLFHTDNDEEENADDADNFDFEDDADFNDSEEDNDDDDDTDDFDIDITKKIPGYSPFRSSRRNDADNFFGNEDNITGKNNEEKGNEDDDQEDDAGNNDLSRFK